MTAQELMAHIKRTCKPDDEVAAILWGANDVLEHAVENEIECSREEANEIMRSVDSKADCETGITWTTIDCALQDLEDSRTQK